jgi:8-oxo-dGTP diphosphatase
MDGPVLAAHELVSRIRPWDPTEAEHRADALTWLETTNDVFRRAKPAMPDPHLVAYAIVVDPADGSTLLVDHINADL